jgi:ubiquinone/menaquinone biosynthesis C-methylase UbiE
MDVGGGHGELLCAILKEYPSMRGVIYDQAACAAGAQQQLTQAGVGGRGEFVAGNFLNSVPHGPDALMLKSVIHNWDDKRTLTILRNCRRALRDHGKLLLIEWLKPERLEVNADHRAVALADLNMLRGLGGQERTEREHRELLQVAGFKIAKLYAADRFSVIEATAV